jgi:hypothetical protein
MGLRNRFQHHAAIDEPLGIGCHLFRLFTSRALLMTFTCWNRRALQHTDYFIVRGIIRKLRYIQGRPAMWPHLRVPVRARSEKYSNKISILIRSSEVEGSFPTANYMPVAHGMIHVSAMLDQQPGDLVAFLLCSTKEVTPKCCGGVHQWREAPLVGVIDVSPQFKQLPRDVNLAVEDCPTQRCVALVIRRVHWKTVFHQAFTFFSMSFTCRIDKRIRSTFLRTASN